MYFVKGNSDTINVCPLLEERSVPISTHTHIPLFQCGTNPLTATQAQNIRKLDSPKVKLYFQKKNGKAIYFPNLNLFCQNSSEFGPTIVNATGKNSVERPATNKEHFCQSDDEDGTCLHIRGTCSLDGLS